MTNIIIVNIKMKCVWQVYFKITAFMNMDKG